MTALLPIARPASLREARGWNVHLLVLGAAVALLLLLYRRDAVDIVRIWLESSTFNHCILIPPIIFWLVWQRLADLRGLVPASWALGLAIVAAGAIGWLLGEAGGVALLRHAAFVLMLQGAVAACLGKAVTRALAFPLFYAVFMIPFGEELVPPMQALTARISMVLLDLVGMPAHLEGIFISTPAGLFEVAEACSGVKFLVAMLAYGALVANLCFRSVWRRAAFMAAAVVVPVLANGVRAWATIYVASFVGIDAAAGFDHVVYGWIFFAIVIALLMAVGWPFFDRAVDAAWFDTARLQPAGSAAPPVARLLLATVLILILAAVPLLWSSHLAARSVQDGPGQVTLPAPPGWEAVPLTGRSKRWKPHFDGADILRVQRYRDRQGREVDLAVAVYSRQQEGHELVGFGQGAADPDRGWTWIGAGTPPPAGRLDRIASSGGIREVATFYRVGETVTGRPLVVKLETMKARLLGGRQRAIAVLVSADSPGEGISPRPAIDSFLTAIGPIDRFADRIGQGL